MLKNHPEPPLTQEIYPIIQGLRRLEGDRINTTSQIPYASLATYLDRNVPVEQQSYYEELMYFADCVYVDKLNELIQLRQEQGRK